MDPSFSLQNILWKKKGSAVLLENLLGSLPEAVCLEDREGNILYGSPVASPSVRLPLNHEEGAIGWVSGNRAAEVVAPLLQHLIELETGRKKMGNEVLNMYREINLIYHFSEKLADTIEPASIARMALEEASRLLPFRSGAVILYDEEQLRFNILAQTGPSLLHKQDLFQHGNFIRSLAASSRTEIISEMPGHGMPTLEGIRAMMFAALKVKNRSIGSIVLACTQPDAYKASDLKLFTTLALQSASSIESALLYEKTVREALEREESMRRIHEVTSKFVPFEFIRALGRNSLTDLRLGDHVERTVTVLFTDVRDYTARAEQMTPEESFNFVSELNGFIGPIIRQNRGFVNQYLGDGVMAIFPAKADDALKAALSIQKAIETYNKKQPEKPFHHRVEVGIGMHTGSLIMGITGDHQRMEAATISDTVNTAARIEGLTKTYQASIILTKETLDAVVKPSDFNLLHLGDVQLKGKMAPVSIYECRMKHA
jgi:class 3 adenylate cyclase